MLVTPARNEERYIGLTLDSVIGQTRQPLKWVVVSDGSTDRTDEIVTSRMPEREWLDFIRMPEHRDRHFAAKVQCFNAGFARLKDLDYDVIGSLDADISFEPDYFDFLLEKFEENPRLGVAGTPFVEDGFQYDYRFTNIEHVSGACQLFRRECFEEIGGYIPIRGGGIDWTAVTTARMKGWQTRTFTEKTCRHHRAIGTGNSDTMGAWFRQGKKDYFLGGHPAWQLFRMVYQMKNRPFVMGGLVLMLGYTWAGLSGIERPIPQNLMAFHRKEQIKRLKRFLFKKVGE